jgi:hypothetical protein
MLHAGLDPSRRRLDVCLVDDVGEVVAQTAAATPASPARRPFRWLGAPLDRRSGRLPPAARTRHGRVALSRLGAPGLTARRVRASARLTDFRSVSVTSFATTTSTRCRRARSPNAAVSRRPRSATPTAARCATSAATTTCSVSWKPSARSVTSTAASPSSARSSRQHERTRGGGSNDHSVVGAGRSSAA